MKQSAPELVILLALLLFEIWNVITARRRGEMFLSLMTYERNRNAKDFKAAFILNIFFIAALVIVIVFRICHLHPVTGDAANTNSWVSIGKIDSGETERRLPVFDFFRSNNIPSYPEGYPTCDVMIRFQDVESARALLSTNRPPGRDFMSKWEIRK